jgi:hypothetical protein
VSHLRGIGVTIAHIAELAVGATIGCFLLGVPGWKSKSSIAALGMQLINWLFSFFKATNAGPADQVLKALIAINADDAFSYIGLGMFAGLVVFQFGGAAVIIGTTYLDYREGPRIAGSGALELAMERGRRFLGSGLVPYNDWREKQKGKEDAHLFRNRTLEFSELMTASLAQLGAQGRMSAREAEGAVRQMGGVLLRTVFEASGSHSEWRLAIYRLEGDKLLPIASTGPTDVRPITEALDYPRSFLGAVIQEGCPDVWYQGKSTNKPYQSHGSGVTRYKCFYAQNVPCDLPEVKWGGLTVDYIKKKPKVFTDSRKKAIRAYARYVQMVYALAQKEDSHEASARSAVRAH